MEDKPAVNNAYLEPGHVYFPAGETRLCSVVSFGIVVTLYDRVRRTGGMCHYLYPYRKVKHHSTPMYACPAVVALSRMMLDTGSKRHDLEAQIFGGALAPASETAKEYAHQNIEVAVEILEKIGIQLNAMDVGGQRGRKIVFNTDNGETAVFKVNKIRSTDWSTGPQERRSRQ